MNRPPGAAELQRLADRPRAPANNDDPRPPAYSDEALALRFAERHRDDLRFVARWSKWMTWDGRRWKEDDTLLGFDFARQICREVAAECNNPKVASTIASAKTVAAVERLPSRIGASQRPLINSTAMTGCSTLRAARSTFARWISGSMSRPIILTKMTAVGPGGACPTWHAFLDRVTR